MMPWTQPINSRCRCYEQHKTNQVVDDRQLFVHFVRRSHATFVLIEQEHFSFRGLVRRELVRICESFRI